MPFFDCDIVQSRAMMSDFGLPRFFFWDGGINFSIQTMSYPHLHICVPVLVRVREQGQSRKAITRAKIVTDQY